MPEKLGLTHKEAAILLNAVFTPFMQCWQSDARLRPLVEDRAQYFHFLAEMAQVLGALLHGKGDALMHLKSLCQQAQAAGLPLDAVEAYALEFLDTFARWVEEVDEALLTDGRETVLQRIAHLKAGRIHCEAGDEDLFVIADSGHSDADIDSMHNITAGRDAISAEAFLEEGYLDESTIERIVDDINDLTEGLYFYTDFTQDYADFITRHLEDLARALENTLEFDDLAWAVRQFIHVLENVPDDLDPEQAVAVKQLADQVVEDLAGWVNHVLVERDAQDIHYLDAALMAAVKQIAMLLGVQLESPGAPGEGGSDHMGSDDDFLMF